MGKCLTCGKTGFLLKLTNEMCNSCYSELQELEKNYDEIVDEISNDNYNSKLLEGKLNKLIVKIRKFQSLDKVLSVDDCLRVLSSLNSSPISSNPSDDLSINNDNGIQQEEFKNTQSPIIDNNVISTHTKAEVKSTNEANPSVIIKKEETKTTVEHSNIILQPQPQPQPQSQLTNTSVPDNSVLVVDTSIINNLYDETSKLIDKISDTSLPIEDLAYHLLLLKNTYLKNLNKYNIKEVNGHNIKRLIDTTSAKVAIKLKCEKDQIDDFYNYVTVGIQTTGQFLPNSEILEIYAHKINFGKVVDSYHTLINPIKPMSRLVEVSTGICANDVQSAPSVETALQEFSAFCNGMKIVSYHVQFVTSFLNHYSNLFFLDEFNNNTECLLKLYRIRYKNFHGEPCKTFDLATICADILNAEDLIAVSSNHSKAFSSSMAAFKLYEILKYKYK